MPRKKGLLLLGKGMKIRPRKVVEGKKFRRMGAVLHGVEHGC